MIKEKIKGFFKALILFVPRTAMLILKAIKAFIMMVYHFVMRYVQVTNEYTAPIQNNDSPRWWAKYAPIRYLVRFFLYLFIPIIALLVPVGLTGTVIGILVAIDQATRPDFSVDSQFVNIAKAVDGKKPTLRDIGSTIFSATYLQMEKEVNSPLGWTANDIMGLQYWDNRVNRQLGVRHASIELLSAVGPAISKFGSIDEEDQRLVTARQRGISYDPYNWMFPRSEDNFRSGIDMVKSYQKDLRFGAIKNANINITNKDLETILIAIDKRVLEVPHGKLNNRNRVVKWTELDDRVFFAQGSAIVARDALVAIRYAFEEKITDAGAIENLNEAIGSLEGAINFHPWWIMRGDADAMFADHRAKMSRYYNDARQRIINVADAINR